MFFCQSTSTRGSGEPCGSLLCLAKTSIYRSVPSAAVYRECLLETKSRLPQWFMRAQQVLLSQPPAWLNPPFCFGPEFTAAAPSHWIFALQKPAEHILEREEEKTSGNTIALLFQTEKQNKFKNAWFSAPRCDRAPIAEVLGVQGDAQGKKC